jgi:hypothetical protein
MKYETTLTVEIKVMIDVGSDNRAQAICYAKGDIDHALDYIGRRICQDDAMTHRRGDAFKADGSSIGHFTMKTVLVEEA